VGRVFRASSDGFCAIKNIYSEGSTASISDFSRLSLCALGFMRPTSIKPNLLRISNLGGQLEGCDAERLATWSSRGVISNFPPNCFLPLCWQYSESLPKGVLPDSTPHVCTQYTGSRICTTFKDN